MKHKVFSRLLCGTLLAAAMHLTAAAQKPASTLTRSTAARTAEDGQTAGIPSGTNTLNYTTSWIGNSLPGNGPDATDGLRHIPLDIDGIFATPDGKIYTNTTWDEGGRPVSIFKNGQLISPLNALNNSPNFSNGGGSAVAADKTHIFKSNTPNGTGVSILDAATLDGTTLTLNGSITLNDSHGVEGMAVAGGKLYLTQEDFNKVEVYDLATLSLVQTVAIPTPALIAVDKSGGLCERTRTYITVCAKDIRYKPLAELTDQIEFTAGLCRCF